MNARPFTLISAHATGILAVGVFAALLVPGLAPIASPLMAPVVWGLLFTAMLRIDWRSIAGHARRPVPVIVALAWMLAATPVLAALVVFGLGVPAGVAAAVVLMAAAPPITGAPALALLIGLDGAMTLVVMVAATMVMPFTLPLVAVGLLGIDIRMDAVELALRLSGLVGSALAAAYVVQRWIGRVRLAGAGAMLDAALVVLLTLFAIAIMEGVPARFFDNPLHVLLVTAISFAANAGLQAASALAFAWTGRSRALSLAFASGNRNMAVLLAILPQDVHPDVVLYFAIAQLPMYVSPAVLKPMYRRLLAKAALKASAGPAMPGGGREQ